MKIRTLLCSLLVATSSMATLTITHQEFQEGYRLTTCEVGDFFGLICRGYTNDYTVFDYVKRHFGSSAEVVEVDIRYLDSVPPQFVIKFRLNKKTINFK